MSINYPNFRTDASNDRPRVSTPLAVFPSPSRPHRHTSTLSDTQHPTETRQRPADTHSIPADRDTDQKGVPTSYEFVLHAFNLSKKKQQNQNHNERRPHNTNKQNNNESHNTCASL